MGFNATVMVLLDRLGDIERDPNFGMKLANAIRYRASISMERDISTTLGHQPFGAEATGQTLVIEVHHADNFMVCAVGGNCGRVLGWGGGYRNDDDAIIKQLIQSRSWRKKPRGS